MVAAKKVAAEKVPAGARAPQDRKPKKSAAARKAEADGVAVIRQCGIELRIELDNVPVKALLRFDGRNDDLSKIEEPDLPAAQLEGSMFLLGAKQWAALLERNPGTRDFAQIGEKFAALVGN